MICNKCGAKNNDTRTKCFHCGYPLEKTETSINTPAKNDASNLVIEEFTVEDAITEESDEQTDFVETKNIESDDFYIEETNEISDENIIEDEELDIFLDNENFDEEFEQDIINNKTKKDIKPSNSNKNSAFTVAIWILCLVFIIGSILVGTLIYQYISDNNDINIDPTKNTVSKLNLPKPEITKLKDNSGIEYVHAVFKGTSGDRLHLKCNNTYHTFITDTLEVDLYLEDLFDIEYEFIDSTVNANLNAYYVRDSKEYSYDANSFQMTVPEADLDTSKLSSQNIKVYNDKYQIEFWTSSNAKVELNNKNITSSMDGTGNFKYEVNIEPDSKNTYSLSVTQPYRIPKTIVFVINRDPLPVTLTVAANNSESISDNTITLKCQTEEGATITSNLPIIQSIKNELYNTCEITLSLENCDYGEIEALITATSSKGTSTKSHKFMYWPDEKTITTSSNKFTSAVATNPANYKNRNYVLNSVKVTKNIGANTFEGVVNLNGVDYTVIIDRKDVSSNVIIGSNYKIFAQCTGNSQNNSSVFRAWFIYNA
ncbi:MAG: hypothetical protein E7365_04520 [Clostridiales bacterium]|nr:hypothetical protein [Clostridiales bacterium]